MSNPLAPDLMTAEERLSEVAQIIAGALLRLRRRESDKHDSDLEKNSLDFPGNRSVHATTGNRRRVAR
jgi:predicted ATPase